MRIVRKTLVGAYAVIVKEEKIALIKKACGGDKGNYDLPGGGIEHDEDPIDALHRECKEELGGTVLKAGLWDTASVNVKWRVNRFLTEDLQRIGILYKVEIKESRIKSGDDCIDSDGAVWVKMDKLTEENTSPLLWYVIEKLKKGKK